MRTVVDKSHMDFESMIENIYSQIHSRQNHMDKFIHMDIEDYLKTDSIKSFVSEWIFLKASKLNLAICSFISMYKNTKRFSKELQNLSFYLLKHNDEWFKCEKDKDGKFIDGTSKFMKLVRKRKVAVNFDKRVDDNLSFRKASA